MNDGACDPQGRLGAGTMAYDESSGAGTLYRLELDGRCTTVLTGLTISNGTGWSPDASMIYLNDSGTGCVDVFRFDGTSGAISGRRTLVHIDQPGVVLALGPERVEPVGGPLLDELGILGDDHRGAQAVLECVGPRAPLALLGLRARAAEGISTVGR